MNLNVVHVEQMQGGAETTGHVQVKQKRHRDAEGRDFGTVRKTLNVRVAIAKTQAEAQAIVERRMRPGSHPVVGDPAAVREQRAELADLGFDYSVLTFMNFQELDDRKLFVDQEQTAD